MESNNIIIPISIRYAPQYIVYCTIYILLLCVSLLLMSFSQVLFFNEIGCWIFRLCRKSLFPLFIWFHSLSLSLAPLSFVTVKKDEEDGERKEEDDGRGRAEERNKKDGRMEGRKKEGRESLRHFILLFKLCLRRYVATRNTQYITWHGAGGRRTKDEGSLT